MSVLVLVEHDNQEVKASTLNTVQPLENWEMMCMPSLLVLTAIKLY